MHCPLTNHQTDIREQGIRDWAPEDLDLGDVFEGPWHEAESVQMSKYEVWFGT
jgi:hypothetical protein